MLFKNSVQKIHVYAYDSTTGAAKTGDAANITGYVSLDGTANAIDDTNPTEVDSTNMPGVYIFDLTAAETNCNSFALFAKSATASIRIEPIIGFTTAGSVPNAVAGAATGLAIVGSEMAANLTKVNGAAQTATLDTIKAAIDTDTVAEMAQGAPPVAASLKLMVNYLYRKFRNKQETTATVNSVYDDAGTTVLFKETHGDDGTTFSRGEYGTGA